ncbi:MAG: fibronectin type III domain-containing protein, partial [Nitrososphaerales archaeon]
QVSAISQSGTGPPSPEAYVQIVAAQNIVPAPPTGLTAIAVSPIQINLSWTPPAYNGGPAITGYRIDVKAGAGSYAPLSSNTGATTTFSHSGLTTGTTYYYKVYAINSVGTSAASSESSATPTSSSSSSVPNPPTNLIATQASSNQINLSWAAPSSSSPITGYKIEEKIGTGSYSIIVQNTGNTNTAYSRTGLSSGITYYYRVSAINSAGTSNPSNEATPGQTTTGVPNPPTSLSVAASSSTQLTLTWTAPSGPAITGYKIEVRVGSSGNYNVLNPNAGTTTSYTHSGLTTGTTYYYKVSSINSVGTSSAAEASGKPTSSNVPTSLTSIAASSTTVKLCWYA